MSVSDTEPQPDDLTIEHGRRDLGEAEHDGVHIRGKPSQSFDRRVRSNHWFNARSLQDCRLGVYVRPRVIGDQDFAQVTFLWELLIDGDVWGGGATG